MLKALVAEGLFGIVRAGALQGDPVDDVSDQMKAIKIVHHHHIEWSRGRPFFLVPAHVQVLVVGPPVGQSVDQPGVTVKRKDDRLIRREQGIDPATNTGNVFPEAFIVSPL